MAKKLVPDYDIELGKDSNLKQGIIQNIFDKIAQSEKQIYAKMNAPISRATGQIASFNDIARNFIRKNIDDTVFSNISFDKSIKSSNFSTGVTGSGWSLSTNDAGRATLEIDDVIVRNSLRAQTLTYERINTAGGTLIVSAAWCTVIRSKTTNTIASNRIGIYYKPDGVSGQRWVVGDQALVKSGFDKYLLTVVTAVNSSPNEDGEYYIELYNNDIPGIPGTWMEKSGSYIPQKDDVIVQYGNRITGNESRQNIIVISSIEGEDGYPVIQQYKGVNDFNLSNKTTARISKDVYFGSPDASKYLWWNKDNDGKFRIKGTILQSPSGDEFPNMIYRGEWAYYTSYFAGDLTTYSGSTYLCITDDNPSLSNPGANARWQIYASKGETGAAGTPGVNSRSVSLTANNQVFEYDSNGYIKPSQGSSTITATALNTTGTVYYNFYVNGVSVQNTTSSTYVLSPSSSISNMPKTVYVYIMENNTTGPSLAADIITIYGVREGGDAYTIVMSNEAHTIPCNPDGSVITYAGTGNKVSVYKGAVRLTPVFSTPASWTGKYLFTRALKTGYISQGNAFIVGNEIILEECYNMNRADDVVVLSNNFNIENKVTASRDQTFTKTKNGAEGIQGMAVRYTRWKSGIGYFNGNISGNPDRYIDYVTDYDYSGIVAAYKCIVSHTSEISKKPGSVGGAAYWESISYVPVIASDLVLANQAVIGGFVFSPAYDEFGNPVAAANQQFRSSDSAINPSILIKGNGYASFAKGNVKFDENGNTNIKGFVEAVGGKIGTMSITGVLSAAGIEISPTAIESLVDLATTESEDLTATYTEDTGVDEQAYAQILSLEPTFTGFTEVRVDIFVDQIQFDNTMYDVIITEDQDIIASYHGVPIDGDTITIIDAIHTKEFKTYNIDAFISVGDKFGSGTQTNYLKIYGTGTGGRLVNTGVKLKTKLSSEGFFSFWSADDYVYFKNAGEFSVRKGSYGMRITTSGIQKWINGTGWVAINYAKW